ncbi:MAG: hypothetical protein JW809_05125 [Pirellulales bacterium]|nr:hypothetical protein [Pirellulales bacterium]
MATRGKNAECPVCLFFFFLPRDASDAKTIGLIRVVLPYGVGVIGKDDGAKEYVDRENDEERDNLVVRASGAKWIAALGTRGPRLPVLANGCVGPRYSRVCAGVKTNPAGPLAPRQAE